MRLVTVVMLVLVVSERGLVELALERDQIEEAAVLSGRRPAHFHLARLIGTVVLVVERVEGGRVGLEQVPDGVRSVLVEATQRVGDGGRAREERARPRLAATRLGRRRAQEDLRVEERAVGVDAVEQHVPRCWRRNSRRRCASHVNREEYVLGRGRRCRADVRLDEVVDDNATLVAVEAQLVELQVGDEWRRRLVARNRCGGCYRGCRVGTCCCCFYCCCCCRRGWDRCGSCLCLCYCWCCCWFVCRWQSGGQVQRLEVEFAAVDVGERCQTSRARNMQQ